MSFRVCGLPDYGLVGWNLTGFKSCRASGASRPSGVGLQRRGQTILIPGQDGGGADAFEGRCGEPSPLEGVVAHNVAARGRLSPPKIN